MKFSLFKPPMDRYLLKSRELLANAKIKRVEHQAAAEHHGALTRVYAERISRIEAEISEALQESSRSSPPALASHNESVGPRSDPVLFYPPRASRA